MSDDQEKSSCPDLSVEGDYIEKKHEDKHFMSEIFELDHQIEDLKYDKEEDIGYSRTDEMTNINSIIDNFIEERQNPFTLFNYTNNGNSL